MRRSRRSPSAYPRTCCGSSRCVSRSSAAGVRRLPAIPKRAFLFRGRRQRVAVTHARIAFVRPRGVPSRTARTSAHSRALFSPPRFRAFPTRALPRNRVATLLTHLTHDASFAHQKGTVAWISHLGARAPRLSGFLLARGFPGNAPAEGLTRFLRANVPAAIGFVAPHSLLPPRRMHGACKRLANILDAERVGFWFGSFAARFLRRPGSGRLLYNAVSAGTLHFLLANFTPLTTPVVASLPFPEDAHVFLSVSCLSLAVASMLAEPQTYGLLGTGQMLGWSPAFATPPPNHMDAITWMGVSAWRGGKQLLGERFLFARYVDAGKKAKHGDVLGATAFVLFTGLSILPKELTFGDCLTRGVAAFYLRRRSRSFRDWVASVEGAHLVTWGIRACLLFAAFRAATDHDVSTKSDGKMSPAAATACAAATAALLRFAERDKNKKSERRTRLTKKHVFETRDDAASVKSARKTEQPRESLRAFRDEGHDAPSASVVEVSFRDIEPEGTKKTRRSARVSSRAA